MVEAAQDACPHGNEFWRFTANMASTSATGGTGGGKDNGGGGKDESGRGKQERLPGYLLEQRFPTFSDHKYPLLSKQSSIHN
ncbi:hypothetical protein E2C01_033408 [Portunus trituberculatus]|uniref:Uncharacterized protein n=1 Tax=Portunus trituberculatus TaxID=210409 RepID=A0A5B7F3Z9_PORTR|nr:hypothetical protein [Portunus trituberculatus]